MESSSIMKKSFILVAIALGIPSFLQADPAVIASDDATQAAYSSTWVGDTCGGNGFGKWVLLNVEKPESQSHAGFFIADTHNNPELSGAASGDKAFGLFANGPEFENATAFRTFSQPLGVGDSFSLTLQHGELVKKGTYDDNGASAVGLTLRSGAQSAGVDDYNKGARFEFGVYKDNATYLIYDGESNNNSGIPVADGGLKLTFKLVTADTYDLTVTTLKDNKTTTLSGRKLGGTAGGTLDSFCIFDRNGEKSDVYFNSLQVSKDSAPASAPSASPTPAPSTAPTQTPAAKL
jgi:hypothetical protein